MGLDMYLYKTKGKYDHELLMRVRNALDTSAQALYDYVKEECSELSDSTEETEQATIDRAKALYAEKELEIFAAHGLTPEMADQNNDVEVAYWRKHSDLNEYMTSLYYQKTPKEFQAQEFNLERLVLEKEDIQDLMDKVSKELEKQGSEFKASSGFFWGATAREDWIETLDKLNTIMETTDFENETIYYSCWY